MFYVSMVLIVLGTGLLKPNVSSIVGDLYSEKDVRRDGGFSIFYMGINLGGFLAPLVTGTLGMDYNFHLGFGAAAVGMFLGLVVYVATRRKYLGLAGTLINNPVTNPKKTYTCIGIGAAVIAMISAIAITSGLLTIHSFISLVGILGFVIPAIYFIVMYRSKRHAVERSRLIAYIPLFIASVMFWAIQEQGATILASYADQRTQLEVMASPCPRLVPIPEPALHHHPGPCLRVALGEAGRPPAFGPCQILARRFLRDCPSWSSSYPAP